MASAASPSLPATIGRYQILSELGHGAMGVVYRGYDPNIGRTVAIKTVLLDQGDPETLLRFRREAQAAGVLSHPNIVTIYDAGEDQGAFYIAMEFVEGETLQDIIARGTVPLEQVTTIVEQVGAALDHAHTRQIIHRDVKPANIMLRDGVAKIMDFGVAKISNASMTATGLVMGTPAYMSPETVKGLPVDGRADLFSLGVMLYEMLTGKKPFVGDTIPTLIFKIVGEAPQAPSVVNSQLDPSLNTVLLKALAKEAAERYQTCAELASDLRNYRVRSGAGFQPALAPAPPAPLRPPEGTVAVDLKVQPVLPVPPRSTIPKDRPLPPLPRIGPVSRLKSKSSLAVSKFVMIASGAAVLLTGASFLWKARQEALASNPPPAPTKLVSVRKAAPPALPKPAPHTAGGSSVLITANVDAAVITVDGHTQADWVTPHRITLAPGAHRIEASKPGYNTRKMAMNIGPDAPSEIKLKLAPSTETPAVDTTEKPVAAAAKEAAAATTPRSSSIGKRMGRLRVISRPPGAVISIDDTITSFRTPVNLPIAEGRHKITVIHRGIEPATREVLIVHDQLFILEFELDGGSGAAKRRFPFQR